MREGNYGMVKKLLSLVFAVNLACTLMACGGGEKSTSSAYSTAEEANYDTGEVAAYAEEAAGSTANGEVNESAQSSNRKLIKNVNLSVETKEYDSLMVNLENEIKNLGGYIESMDAYNGNSYYTTEGRYATIVARIPAAALDGFVSKVGEEANVTNRSESVEDVTLNYVDMESHKKMLTEEQERLMQLLEEASSIEDIITIESRLSEVRYQIESMESQLRTYDNQVDYSTVTLSIQEVKELTPVVEESTGERIRNGFLASCINVLDGIKEFFVSLIIALPYLIIWGVILTIAIFIIVKIVKKSDARSKRLAEERSERMAHSVAGQRAALINEKKETFVRKPEAADDKKENE